MRLCSIAIVSALAACVPAAEGEDADGGEAGADNGIAVEDEGDGVYVTVVDARDEAAWQRFDFESRGEVDESSAAWDLGFSRFNVETRVEVAVLADQEFAGLTRAPADGYVTDGPAVDPADMETMPGYAFDLWYAYDPATHVLAARDDVVYVVRSAEGNYFKVQMLDYYDDAGTSGYVSLRWAAVAAP